MTTFPDWPRFYREGELLDLMRELSSEYRFHERFYELDIFHTPGTGDISSAAELRCRLSAFFDSTLFYQPHAPTSHWSSLTYGDFLFILFDCPYTDLPLQLFHQCPVIGYIARWRLRLGM